MFRKTPQEIITHLQDAYCDEDEKEAELIKQEEDLKLTHDPAELPQTYFASLQQARMILVSLEELIIGN